MPKLPKIFLALIALLILAVAGVYGGAKYLLSPVANTGEDTKFVVAKGQGIVAIGAKLEEAKLIRSKHAFRAYVLLNKIDKKIQAGTFTLSPAQSTPEIAQALTEGTEDVWITLLEGWRREEIAEYLEKAELSEFDSAEFLELTSTFEGYLFPDTYLVPREITTAALVDLFTTTFETKVATLGDLTPSEVERLVILASLVEREARGSEQIRRVAGILENRLELGMALQVDATLQYIRGRVGSDWWAPPLVADKERKSAFNTYLNAGLPPRPIANPGLSALQAVHAPLASDDYFYLHAPTGEIYYAETYEEHLVNISRYLQ
ncbi:MAG: endolytic transglycosylase MltG [bacterium]|nr:endolytic transglycosylase MltG [bacterium]